MTLCLAFLTLLAVLFFATHPDALGQLFGLVIGGALVWYGVKVTFAQPKRRSRSRSRSRRYGGPHSPTRSPTHQPGRPGTDKDAPAESPARKGHEESGGDEG